MPFVQSGGRAIYYERHGEGNEPVLFCHGAGSIAATWWQAPTGVSFIRALASSTVPASH